jgi:hypothetical protein
MSAADARLALLAAEIDRDFAEVKRQLERAEQHDPSASGPNAAWVALALDHAYAAFESLLVRSERALDLPPRQGERWHLDLLEASALDVPGLRPAIVPREALSDWLELLKFRHFLRHAYAADLDPKRLADNVSRLRRAAAATAPKVGALVAALRP